MPVLSCGTMRFQQTMGGKDLAGTAHPHVTSPENLFEPVAESQAEVNAIPLTAHLTVRWLYLGRITSRVACGRP